MSTNGESPVTPPNPLDLVLAQTVPVDDLPGFFRKWASIGPAEAGLLVSRGQVMRSMDSGRRTVAWKFLGLGSSDRSVVWIQTGPFTSRLHFNGLLSRDLKSVDALVTAFAHVENPDLFYRTVVGDGDRLDIFQLSGVISAALDDVFQFKVSEHNQYELLGDGGVQSEVASALEPDIRRALAERGIHLETIGLVRFRATEEEEKYSSQVEALTDIKRGDPDAIRSVESVLLERGLITEEELTRIGTTGGLIAVQEKVAQRMESQDVSQGESLAKRLEEVDGAEPDMAPKKASVFRFVPTAGVLVVIVGFVVWLATGALNPGAIVGGIAGLAASIWGLVGEARGFLIGLVARGGWAVARRKRSSSSDEGMAQGAKATMAQTSVGLPGLNFVIFLLAITLAPGFFIGAIIYSQDQQTLGIVVGIVVAAVGAAGAIAWQLSHRKKPFTTGVEIGRPELDKWIERNTLRTDDLVRRQVARDLDGAFEDITSVRMELYREGVRDAVDDLRSLENDVDAFRTEVNGAAFGSRNLGDNSRASRGRIKRLLNFEEDLSRRARNFGIHVQKMREAGSKDRAVFDGEFRISRELVDSLKRIFAQRANILEGFEVHIR